jgi:hypothetical protein
MAWGGGDGADVGWLRPRSADQPGGASLPWRGVQEVSAEHRGDADARWSRFPKNMSATKTALGPIDDR